MKIAVLATALLLPEAASYLEAENSTCVFSYHTYSNYHDLLEAYGRNYDLVDGYFVDNILAARWIAESWPICKKPVISFDSDLVSLCRVILGRLSEGAPVSPRRCYVDFLEAMLVRADILSWEEDALYLMGPRTGKIPSMGLEELGSLTRELLAGAERAWRGGEADMILVTFSGLAEELSRREIPFRFVVPSHAQMKSALTRLMGEIQLRELSEGRPAVLCLTYPRTAGEDADLRGILLEEALKNYRRSSLADFILRSEGDRLEAFASMRTVAYMTAEQTDCSLARYLEKALTFPVSIGYGCGSDLIQAEERAIRACREAAYRKNTCSYLVDSMGTLVGPLTGSRTLLLPEHSESQNEEIAHRSGLSVINVQKLRAVMRILQTDELFAQDIASQLGITLRSGNRMLVKLQEAGYAAVTTKVHGTSRGRPKLRYRLAFDQAGH